MKNIFEGTVLISNIQYIYPELPTGNGLRIAIGALSLTNQKSNFNDNCDPMMCGWNENPAVKFADFQWWLKCHIEKSNFIVEGKKIPLNKELLLYPKIDNDEPSAVVLEFEDGTRIELAVRDPLKPIEICVLDGTKSIQDKIKEYGGYTELLDPLD